MRLKLRVSGGHAVGKTMLLNKIISFLHDQYDLQKVYSIKESTDKGVPVERVTVELVVK